QIKQEPATQALGTDTRDKEWHAPQGPNENSKSNSQISQVVFTKYTPYDGSENNSNMICGSGNSRPAKLFTCKKRRLEYGKRSQGKQRKEDDTCILNGKQFLLNSVPSNLNIWDEPGRYKEKADGCHQHDNKNKIYYGED